MPVKNAGAYLVACINSIIKQTEGNWQLVAINDHSTDDSLAYLLEHAKKDKRIEVYNNAGNGIIDALRLAYAKSKGDLITRMDADDIMAADKLTLLKQALLNNGAGYVAVGAVEYFSEKTLGNGYLKYANWLNELTQHHQNFSELYKECVVPSPCWMVYKTDLDACGAFDADVYPEDYDLCFRFYAQKLRIVGMSKVIHYWRDYPNRTSRTDEKYADNRFLDLKLHYFLKLDYRHTQNLTLWGAGDKGKYLARQLLELNVDFKWLCNNSKKIGHCIYGKIIVGLEDADISQAQYIIAVAQKNANNEIVDFMDVHYFKKGEDYFFFC